MSYPLSILTVKNPDKIAVYDAPPALGGRRRLLSIEALNAELGIDFSESLFVDNQETLEELLRLSFQAKRSIPYRRREQQLDERLQKPFSGLALAKINENVGYGVFAERDIPADTMLCIYSGRIKRIAGALDELKGDDYLMVFDDEHRFAITAELTRGFAGFMQHLPRNHDREARGYETQFMDDKYMSELLNLPAAFIKAARTDGRISDDIVKQVLAEGAKLNRAADTEWAEIRFVDDKDNQIEDTVASANVCQELIPYKNTHVLAMVTQRPIKKGHMVGLTYTKDYWRRKGESPELFSLHGQIVPRSFYQRRLFSLRDSHDDGTNTIVEFDKPHLLSAIKAGISIDADNGRVIPTYDARNRLVAHGDLPASYGELQPDTLVMMLQERLNSKGVNVSLFWKNPQLVEERSCSLDAYTTEIVCKADSDSLWESMTTFFSQRGLPVTKHKVENLVVIQDCNEPEQRECYRQKLL